MSVQASIIASHDWKNSLFKAGLSGVIAWKGYEYVLQQRGDIMYRTLISDMSFSGGQLVALGVVVASLVSDFFHDWFFPKVGISQRANDRMTLIGSAALAGALAYAAVFVLTGGSVYTEGLSSLSIPQVVGVGAGAEILGQLAESTLRTIF